MTMRRLRAPILVAAVTAVGGVAALAAVRCPTDEPAGSGLLQFGGREHAVALDADAALGVNPLFTWAELEPADDVYNWAPVDAVLTAAHKTGRKVAPRVYTNLVDHGQGTPGWVFEAGAATYTMADWSSTLQPVPADPVFTREFEEFVAAFGARYDGHPAIEFVQTNTGMGAYGEMVWWLDEAHRPPGYSTAGHIETMEAWVDRWRAAFPSTPLVLMQNFIGEGISERVSAYAVDRGYYLQSNSVELAREAAAILSAHDDRTRIILEVENNDCQGATGAEFDDLTRAAFSQGFAIDYLMVCEQTLSDGTAAQRALAMLRSTD